MKALERRNEARVQRADPVQLEWSTAEGNLMRAMGLCVDGSASGMRVEILDMIPEGQSVRFEVMGQDFRGMATARNCGVRGTRALVGLEFAWSKKWRQVA